MSDVAFTSSVEEALPSPEDDADDADDAAGVAAGAGDWGVCAASGPLVTKTMASDAIQSPQVRISAI